MYNYKPRKVNFQESKKELVFTSSDFLELEKNLMGIVDEDDFIIETMGSPSTVDSICQFKQKFDLDKNKKSNRVKISSYLRENWADCAVTFKFVVFDRILNEKKGIKSTKSSNLLKTIQINNNTLSNSPLMYNHFSKIEITTNIQNPLYELN